MLCWFILLGVALCLVLLLWVLQPYRNWKKNFDLRQYEPVSLINTKREVMSLKQFLEIEERHIQLSLVVPSYNEQQRLPVMLEDTAKHLATMGITYEIIIANDGSKDATTDVALRMADKLGLNLVVLEYPRNRGKGGAVRAGMAAAQGNFVLMVDADGATTFSQIDRLFTKIKEMIAKNKHPLALVAGSRRHLEQESKVQRKWHRKLVSGVFKFIITVLLGIDTEDTQCGFKLFTREAKKQLFRALHIERFAFDVELFFLCKKFGVASAEVGVQWRDIDGSKLNVLDASVNMFRDVLMIRVYYWLRLWKASDKVEVK